jgi:hypothetical protein
VVVETGRLLDLSAEERMETVKEAVLLTLRDLGWRGPLQTTMLRFGLDLMADSIRHLFAKRNII